MPMPDNPSNKEAAMYLPDYYEFCCRVKTVAGHQALETIPDLLSDMGAQKPMIVTDQGVSGAGLVDTVMTAMAGKVTPGPVADDVPPDSDLRMVNGLASVYRENGCDAIIAVGGGSVLDTAKAVNILVSEGSDDLMAFTGANALKRKLKPLIAIPTTAGTGSEVTIVAVIADPDKRRKMLFTSPFLLPDAAVIDSRMTLTLPPHITAPTGMDALSHAVEAYTCLAKNPLSDAHALEAIELISTHLVNTVKNPGDRDGRLALATAATLAGIAFSNSMVGMVHTLGHSVGSVCHVPHGTCMAILLPYGLEYNMHKVEDRIAELLFPLAGSEVYASTRPHDRATAAISLIRKLNQDLFDATNGRHCTAFNQVKTPEGHPAVCSRDLEAIARTALGDGSIFYNPEELDFDDCMLVLSAAWDGTPLDRSKVKQG
ncbi:Adh3 [Desulforapulum autotrophicum HRM2]|uniref:Adh3 n=2 Tax=Desulforapulum autotrophicum TaxID=2296 RepID=C0QFC9_DESAH|nr:Adh3 [Desulforapulum autotrophicum HRM2]